MLKGWTMLPLHLDYGIGRYLMYAYPVVGLLVIVLSLVEDSNPGNYSLWVSGVGIVVGIAMTLGGMLYHNMEVRLSKQEEDAMPRREFALAHQEIVNQLARMEKHLENSDSRELKHRE